MIGLKSLPMELKPNTKQQDKEKIGESLISITMKIHHYPKAEPKKRKTSQFKHQLENLNSVFEV